MANKNLEKWIIEVKEPGTWREDKPYDLFAEDRTKQYFKNKGCRDQITILRENRCIVIEAPKGVVDENDIETICSRINGVNVEKIAAEENSDKYNSADLVALQNKNKKLLEELEKVRRQKNELEKDVKKLRDKFGSTLAEKQRIEQEYSTLSQIVEQQKQKIAKIEEHIKNQFSEIDSVFKAYLTLAESAVKERISKISNFSNLEEIINYNTKSEETLLKEIFEKYNFQVTTSEDFEKILSEIKNFKMEEYEHLKAEAMRAGEELKLKKAYEANLIPAAHLVKEIVDKIDVEKNKEKIEAYERYEKIKQCFEEVQTLAEKLNAAKEIFETVKKCNEIKVPCCIVYDKDNKFLEIYLPVSADTQNNSFGKIIIQNITNNLEIYQINYVGKLTCIKNNCEIEKYEEIINKLKKTLKNTFADNFGFKLEIICVEK
ncbi:MAG: hypothetical protein QXQ79_00980 [Candidatus Nanoarchaeia archaeon]